MVFFSVILFIITRFLHNTEILFVLKIIFHLSSKPSGNSKRLFSWVKMRLAIFFLRINFIPGPYIPAWGNSPTRLMGGGLCRGSKLRAYFLLQEIFQQFKKHFLNLQHKKYSDQIIFRSITLLPPPQRNKIKEKKRTRKRVVCFFFVYMR